MAAPMEVPSGSPKKASKRKTEDKQDVQEVEKKPKVDVISAVEFKFLLKDPNTKLEGLQKFTETAKSWSNEEGEDIVLAFCRSSPECAEIFQLLESGSKKLSEVQWVFTCFEKILLRIPDDLNKYYPLGQTVVRKLLTNHAHTLFSALNVQNSSSQIKAALKLLVAMVMLGGATAKLVLDNVDLGHKTMLPLLHRRDIKDEEDVRTCFMHLILACLLAGDNDIIRKLVQTKGVMENVFQGMEYDRLTTLQLVLSTVLEKVIINTGISKTAKIQMFSEKSLKELGHLYNWQGPARWKQSLKKKGKPNKPEAPVNGEEIDGQSLAAELADRFLMEVCTSYKHGIIFYDKSYGLSGRSQNRLMTSFLAYLSGQLGHSLVQKLTIGILKTCPDQLQYFLPHIVHTLVPRETSKWISSMKFLTRIYSSLEKDVSSMRLKEKKTVSNLVEILTVYTLPTSQVMNTVLPGVKDKSLVVSHVTLCLVKQIAETALLLLKSIPQLTVYSEPEKDEICRTYKAFILKNLPDVMTVFSGWDNARAVQTSELEQQKLADFCGATMDDVFIQLEQVLCLYQELHPALLGEHPNILGKLLEGIMGNESGAGHMTNHMTKVYLLKLMAGTEAKRLPWAKQNVNGQTLMYQLLELVVQLSTNADLGEVTLCLVGKLLERTGQFEGHVNDLHLWLKVIQKSDHGALTFVSKVMLNYIHNPYPYMDRLFDLDLQLATLETVETSTKMELTQLGIKDVLEMDLTDLEDEQTDTACTGQRRFPFCPILIAALDMAEKMETPEEDVKVFLSQIVLQTFHRQTFPGAMCKLLDGFQTCPLVPKLWSYIRSWTQNEGEELSGDVLAPQAIFGKLLEDNGDVLRVDSPVGSIHQNLLYMTYVIQNWTRSTEKINSKQLRSLKKAVFNSLKELNDQEKPSTEKLVTEFGLSGSLQTEQEEPVLSAARLVLEHPLVVAYFLFSNTGNQSTKIVSIVTELVVDILETLGPKNEMQGNCLISYHRKILDCVQDKTDFGQKNVKWSTLVKVLSVLLHSTSASKCSEILDHLLNISSGVDDKSNLYVCLLQQFIEKLNHSNLQALKLSQTGFDTLVDMLVCSESSGSGTNLLYTFLKKFPVLAAVCPDGIVGKLLQSTGSTRLVEFLMENNPVAASEVGETIQTMNIDWSTGDNISIVSKYIGLTLLKGHCKGAEKVHKKIIKLFKSEVLSLCGKLDPDHSKKLMELVTYLKCADLLGEKLTNKMKRKLAVTLESEDILHTSHLDLVFLLYNGENMTEATSCDGQELQELLHVCLKCLMIVSRKGKNDLEEKLFAFLAKTSKEDVKGFILWEDFTTLWPSLCSSIVQCMFKNQSALKLFNTLVQTLYTLDDLDLGVTKEEVVTMVMDNPLYVETMFGDHGAECKELLVDLLLVLIELCPSMCSTDHISVFLGAYNASLTLTDQKLLKVMHCYEKNDVSFNTYRPFLWHDKAREQHALRNSLGPSLKTASATQVMANLDVKLMLYSTLNFPLRRKLQEVEVLPADSYKSEPSCYDPCFILPLLSHLLEPESVVDCRRLIETGCIGYTLVALSSHDEHMRNAAQHILEKFQGHLDAARFAEKEQLQYLLYVLQNSVSETKNKLSSIITQFLSRVALLMLKPDDHMYTVINNFLLLKPNMDTGNIPEFFKLFNSSHMQYKLERSWMLSLMHDGLRETADYWIFEKRFAFKLLMSLYDSCVSDPACQILVLKILTAACKVRRLAIDLCQNHGLLAWVALAISKLAENKVTVCEGVCQLLHSLWRSVMEQAHDEKIHAQLSFPVQMLNCLKSLLVYIGDISAATKMMFLKTLSLVLNHLHSIADNLRGHVTQTVSHIEILLLLLNCQKNWAQSTGNEHTLKTVLQEAGFDLSILEKKKDGRKLESAAIMTAKEKEKDIEKDFGIKDTVNEELDHDKNYVVEKIDDLAAEVRSVIGLWIADRSDICSTATACVDTVVIRWILDCMKSEKEAGTVMKMVKLVTDLMTSTKSVSPKYVQNFLGKYGERGLSYFLVTDLLNVYAQIEETFEMLKVKDRKGLEEERQNVIRHLNEGLSQIYQSTEAAGLRNMDDVLSDLMKHHGDAVDSESLRSVAVKRVFVDSFHQL